MAEGSGHSSATTILVWGETQVGKTSWLATALYWQDAFWDLIDRTGSAAVLSSAVFPHWKRLRTGMHTESTSEEMINIDLVTMQKNTVRLRDIRGQLVHDINTESVQKRLIADADGFLFFLSLGSSSLGTQIMAIESMLPFLNGRPGAVIITKCETELEAESEEWLAAPGWWRADHRLAPFASILDQFGEYIWPVSSFGFCQESGASDWPAMTMGEFANTIPFGIGPRNVALPLRWILTELGVR